MIFCINNISTIKEKREKNRSMEKMNIDIIMVNSHTTDPCKYLQANLLPFQ